MKDATDLNCSLAFLMLFVPAGLAEGAAEPGSGSVRKAAIFVENRVGAALNDKVLVFEDFLRVGLQRRDSP